MCSPFESLRLAAREELKACLDVFSQLGAKWMNIHPDRYAPLHAPEFVIEKNLQTLRELLPVARENGVGLMLENLPGHFNTVAQCGRLLDAISELGFHLDIGHANLQVSLNTTEELLNAYSSRLRHVHLHDNRGATDDHLPLGAGTVDAAKHLRSLHATGYDGTITLEVFTPDKRLLAYSRDVVRQMWDEIVSSRSRNIPAQAGFHSAAA